MRLLKVQDVELLSRVMFSSLKSRVVYHIKQKMLSTLLHLQNQRKQRKKQTFPSGQILGYKNPTTDEEKATLKSYQKARLEGDEEKANRLRKEVEEGIGAIKQRKTV